MSFLDEYSHARNDALHEVNVVPSGSLTSGEKAGYRLGKTVGTMQRKHPYMLPSMAIIGGTEVFSLGLSLVRAESVGDSAKQAFMYLLVGGVLSLVWHATRRIPTRR